jgi:hypothetical protein
MLRIDRNMGRYSSAARTVAEKGVVRMKGWSRRTKLGLAVLMVAGVFGRGQAQAPAPAEKGGIVCLPAGYEHDEGGTQQARSASTASMSSKPLFAYVSFYRDQRVAMETAPIAVMLEPSTRLGIVPLKFQVPLGKLAPGPYECQVSVLDPAGPRAAFLTRSGDVGAVAIEQLVKGMPVRRTLWCLTKFLA